MCHIKCKYATSKKDREKRTECRNSRRCRHRCLFSLSLHLLTLKIYCTIIFLSVFVFCFQFGWMCEGFSTLRLWHQFYTFFNCSKNNSNEYTQTCSTLSVRPCHRFSISPKQNNKSNNNNNQKLLAINRIASLPRIHANTRRNGRNWSSLLAQAMTKGKAKKWLVGWLVGWAIRAYIFFVDINFGAACTHTHTLLRMNVSIYLYLYANVKGHMDWKLQLKNGCRHRHHHHHHHNSHCCCCFVVFFSSSGISADNFWYQFIVALRFYYLYFSFSSSFIRVCCAMNISSLCMHIYIHHIQ